MQLLCQPSPSHRLGASNLENDTEKSVSLTKGHIIIIDND